MVTRTTALACIAALAGCTYTKTFGYTPKYDVQLTPEDPEPAGVEARRLLASAKTVAFYPPDRCTNTAEKDETERQFRANCGVMLSYLERAAEKAGYEVVSWVNLRSTENRRALDYAREAKVDVLFEINEISAAGLESDDPVIQERVARTLSFFDRGDQGDVAFTPPPGIQQRCSGWSATHDGLPNTFGNFVAIDIKAVSVSDGRSRWHYRKAELKRDDTEHAPSKLFSGQSKPNKAGNVLAGLGFASMAIGGLMAILDEAFTSTLDPVTGVAPDKTFGSAPYYIMGAGAVTIAAGVTLMIVKAPKKPTPESLLCLETSQSSQEGGSRHYFETKKPDATKTGVQLSDRIWQEKIRESLQEFIAVIDDVKKNPPPMSAPDPAPAPAPAPAPPPTQP
jgi:hypothetical protein